MTRLLVVGYGSIGRRHVQNLRTLGVSDILVCEPDPERRRRAEREGGVGTFPGLEAALDREPTAVVVCTPPASHLPVATEAAARGCALFIEKPLTHRWDGVGEFLEAVAERGLSTMVGCNLRFRVGLRALKDAVRSGAVGRVVSARAEFGQYLPDWHPGEDYRVGHTAVQDLGGGILLDGVHELDYLRWLLGEVEQVACVAGRLSGLEIETEDTAAILLRFESEAIGEVHLDCVQRSYHRSCRVIGEEGTLEWDYVAGETRVFRAAGGQWGVLAREADEEPNRMYVEEMRHFLRCLDGEEEPELDAFGGARVLAIALAAKASAERGEFVRPNRHGLPAGSAAGAPRREGI